MNTPIERLILTLKTGLSDGVVVTGSMIELTDFREQAIDSLTEASFQVSQMDLYSDDPQPSRTDNDVDVLILWGLEQLSPQDNRSYAIRTYLDKARHQGLRFIIFCENSCYSAHFLDHEAPFYHFCFRFPLSER